jgi:hypothetical protein
MTKEELKKEVEAISKSGLEIYEKDKELIPTMFVVFKGLGEGKKDEKALAVVPLITKDSSEKREFVFGLGRSVNSQIRPAITKDSGHVVGDVECIMMASEAWYSEVKDKKPDEDFTPPSQDPNRKEMLIFSGMNEYREVVAIAYKIEEKDGEKKAIEMIMSESKSSESSLEAPLLSAFWDGYMPPVRLF